MFIQIINGANTAFETLILLLFCGLSSKSKHVFSMFVKSIPQKSTGRIVDQPVTINLSFYPFSVLIFSDTLIRPFICQHTTINLPLRESNNKYMYLNNHNILTVVFVR